MEDSTILITMGIITSPLYGLMFYFLKKLNYTCGIITQLVTFSKMIHPKEAKNVFSDST